MRLSTLGIAVLMVAGPGRLASAQAPDDSGIPDLRVEGRVESGAETRPAPGKPGLLETFVYVKAIRTEGAGARSVLRGGVCAPEPRQLDRRRGGGGPAHLKLPLICISLDRLHQARGTTSIDKS